MPINAHQPYKQITRHPSSEQLHKAMIIMVYMTIHGKADVYTTNGEGDDASQDDLHDDEQPTRLRKYVCEEAGMHTDTNQND